MPYSNKTAPSCCHAGACQHPAEPLSAVSLRSLDSVCYPPQIYYQIDVNPETAPNGRQKGKDMSAAIEQSSLCGEEPESACGAWAPKEWTKRFCHPLRPAPVVLHGSVRSARDIRNLRSPRPSILAPLATKREYKKMGPIKNDKTNPFRRNRLLSKLVQRKSSAGKPKP